MTDKLSLIQKVEALVERWRGIVEAAGADPPTRSCYTDAADELTALLPELRAMALIPCDGCHQNVASPELSLHRTVLCHKPSCYGAFIGQQVAMAVQAEREACAWEIHPEDFDEGSSENCALLGAQNAIRSRGDSDALKEALDDKDAEIEAVKQTFLVSENAREELYREKLAKAREGVLDELQSFAVVEFHLDDERMGPRDAAATFRFIVNAAKLAACAAYSEAQREGCDPNAAWDCALAALEGGQHEADS